MQKWMSTAGTTMDHRLISVPFGSSAPLDVNHESHTDETALCCAATAGLPSLGAALDAVERSSPDVDDIDLAKFGSAEYPGAARVHPCEYVKVTLPLASSLAGVVEIIDSEVELMERDSEASTPGSLAAICGARSTNLVAFANRTPGDDIILSITAPRL